MNITLSVDERVVERARKAAESMGKSLNQAVREYLEQLADRHSKDEWIAEMRRLSQRSGGNSRGWKFNRDEIHERKP